MYFPSPSIHLPTLQWKITFHKFYLGKTGFHCCSNELMEKYIFKKFRGIHISTKFLVECDLPLVDEFTLSGKLKCVHTLFKCNRFRLTLSQTEPEAAELTKLLLACVSAQLTASWLLSDTRDTGMERILLISLSLKRTYEEEPPDVADILCKGKVVQFVLSCSVFFFQIHKYMIQGVSVN